MSKAWWDFNCSSYKKVSKITATFSLITDSGYVLSQTDINVPVTKLFIYNDDDFSERVKTHEQVRADLKEQLNICAKKLLKENQRKSLVGLYGGWVQNGKYVVKCIWELCPKSENITYEEYKEWKKLK